MHGGGHMHDGVRPSHTTNTGLLIALQILEKMKSTGFDIQVFNSAELMFNITKHKVCEGKN